MIIEVMSFSLKKGERLAMSVKWSWKVDACQKLLCGFNPLVKGKLTYKGQNIPVRIASPSVQSIIGFVLQRNPNQMIVNYDF